MDGYRDIPLEKVHPNPYVARLLREPAIYDAFGQGQRHRAYELFRARRRASKDPAERAAIDEVLADQRSFLEPIASAPAMATINGVGARLHASGPRYPDGTYVATLAFTLLFVPIFPIAQYLVSDAARGGGFLWGRYHFLGKVPLRESHRRWRKLVAIAAPAAVAALVVVATVSSYVASQGSRVWIANDLDAPVSVAMGGRTFDLPSGASTSARMSKGPYHVQVRSRSGAVIEEQDVVVPGGYDVVAYSVAGASPLYAEQIRYEARSSGTVVGRPPEPTLYVAERWITARNVDYAFRDPPKTIDVSSGSSGETRSHFDRARGGWRAAIDLAEQLGRPSAASRVAENVARAEPENDQAVAYAVATMTEAHDDARLVELTKDLLERHPDAIELHRARQTALQNVGRGEEARATYRALAESHPDSAMYAHLRARLEPNEVATKLYADIVARWPDYAPAHRGYAYVLFQSERFVEAAAQLDEAADADPASEDRFVAMHARALVGAGRVDAALGVVARVADRMDPVDVETALLYARVAKLAPDRAPHPIDYYFVRAARGETLTDVDRAAFAAKVGLVGNGWPAAEAASDPAMRRALEIAFTAPRDLYRARSFVSDAPLAALRNVDAPVLVLLAGELARTGDAATAGRLLDALPASLGASRDAIRAAALDANEDAALEDVDLEIRAALTLARARRERRPDARRALYAAARKEDVLRGAVYDASQAWPEP